MFAAVGRAKRGYGDGKADDDPPDRRTPRWNAQWNRSPAKAEGLDENDPRQAARLMRKFSDMTGLEFKENMKSAIERMEAGEDPEAIEQEWAAWRMRILLSCRKEGEGEVAARRRPPPRRDPKLL